MCEALGGHEGSVSMEGQLITNFHFVDDIVVNAEDKEEAGVLVDRLDTTTTRYKWRLVTKVVKNTPNGSQTEKIKLKRSEARSGERQVPWSNHL